MSAHVSWTSKLVMAGYTGVGVLVIGWFSGDWWLSPLPVFLAVSAWRQRRAENLSAPRSPPR